MKPKETPEAGQDPVAPSGRDGSAIELHDYRKALAFIAPSILGPGAQVWVSEQTFDRLLLLIENAAALEVELEIQSAVENNGRLDLQITATGSNAYQVERMIHALADC